MPPPKKSSASSLIDKMTKPRRARGKRAKKFQKLLVANRGEIAVRIIHTARKMGIKTVAIYSEADTNALHVREADEGVYVGPSPSTQSYLNIEAILAAIRQTGADAVHPGYGFLSENTEFAEALENESVTFVGPPPKAVRLMGDKIEARKIAKKAKVNIVPGHDEAVADSREALKIAKKIGYPVMVKAAAGGGGKGMRVAHNEEELRSAFKTAANEAGSSFKDDRVFIEKFIEKPRHIEIQILADQHGDILSLGERECSIQRRNQKVIEEAPSPFLERRTRERMSRQAIALAKEVGYVSAGTVEFIVDAESNFYFLEMNTRLQVEHRVTELITGLDLVEQMIRVALGEELGITAKDVEPQGWAMETRIYAEDPSRGFLPSTGRISRYEEPPAGEHVLVDSGVYEGGEVSMFYDPMIAKLCTHAPNRLRAIEEMREALGDFVIRGISHNISFLEAILSHPRFEDGDISTHFIEEEYPEGFGGAEVTSEVAKIFLATGLYIYLREAERDDQISGQLPGRKRALGTIWVVSVDDQTFAVDNVIRVPNGMRIELDDGSEVVITSSWSLGRRLFQGVVNDKRVSVKIEHLTEGYRLTHSGAEVRVLIRTPRIAELASYMPDKREDDTQPGLPAPISGKVIAVRVKKGATVKPGNALVVIEAMKMENVIYASHPAKVKAIHIKEGDSVQTGQVIMDFE